MMQELERVTFDGPLIDRMYYSVAFITGLGGVEERSVAVDLNALLADADIATDVVGKALMPRSSKNAEQIMAACAPIRVVVSDTGVELDEQR